VRQIRLAESCSFLSYNIPGVKLRGSRRISDPAPLVWDPLPLITNPVLHNWDPAHSCWDPPLCWVELKHQTLLKCHKNQTECVECSTTPGRRSGTPPLLSAPSGSSFCPSGLVPLGIHHLLLSNLTTVIFHFITLVCGFQNVTGRRQRPIVGHVRHSRRRRPVDSRSCLMNNCLCSSVYVYVWPLTWANIYASV